MSDARDKLATKLDGCKSPTDAFNVMYAEAPAEIQDYLDGRITEILMVDLPKLHILMSDGPAVTVATMESVESTYAQSLAHMEKEHPKHFKSLSATVRDCGHNIGVLIDACVKRVLLDDTDANRHAYINLMAEHAKLVKCLHDIALTEDQKAQIDGWDNDSN